MERNETGGQSRLSRRTALLGLGTTAAGLAAAALFGCKSGGPESISSATPATGTEHLASAGYPTSGWDKLKFNEFRDTYSGNKLKDLPGQKAGPKAGGRIRYASQTPVSFDPTGPTPLTQMLMHNNLVQTRSDDFVPNVYAPTFQPVLAKAMPEQTPDGLTYTFQLNPGVKFHNIAPVNGRELVAEDVAFTYNTYRKSPVQQATLAAVDSVKAIDKYTVQFKMKEPAAYLLADIAAPMYWVFAPEQQQSPGGLKTPIGTGPFLLEKAEPGGNFSFKRNPEYFRKDPRTQMQLPYVDGIDGLKYQNVAAQVAAFRAGEIDTVNPNDFKTWASVMQSNPDSVTDVIPPLPNAIGHIALRLDKAPFNDIRVRRALSMLIDRDAIIDSVCFGVGGHTYGTDFTYFGNKWMWEGQDLGPWVKYNPAEAKKLLQAAGAEKLTIDALFNGTSGIRFDTYSAATAMWEQAGMKVNINAPADTAVGTAMKWGIDPVSGMAGTFPGVYFLSDYTLGADPDIMTYTAMHSKSITNIYHIKDAKTDDLTVNQRHALNKPDRVQILKDLMTYDLDQVTRIWFVEPYKILLRKPNVYNVVDTAWAWAAPAWGMAQTEAVWKA